MPNILLGKHRVVLILQTLGRLSPMAMHRLTNG
jgi:hypothetical protein